MPAMIVDDKSKYCIPFIIDCLRLHQQKWTAKETRPVFFLGLSGVQGAGKSSLVSVIPISFLGNGVLRRNEKALGYSC